MSYFIDQQAIQALIEEFNEEKRSLFLSYKNEETKQYTEEQKAYALSLIHEHGIRGVSRILEVPRRTLQRWRRDYNYPVERCPQWVFERAERWERRKRR